MFSASVLKTCCLHFYYSQMFGLPFSSVVSAVVVADILIVNLCQGIFSSFFLAGPAQSPGLFSQWFCLHLYEVEVLQD